MRYPHIVIFPVNPKSAALFREALNPSGKKDDPVDADSLREMVEKHREKLRPMQPEDPDTRSLCILSESRRKIVHDIVRETHRLRANLKNYFPQALDLVGELDTPMACDFLKRWPALEALQRAQPQTIAKFYREHNSRSSELIEKRLDRIKQAVALSDDEALLCCGALQTRILVGIIRELMKGRDEISAAIEEVYSRHPEHDLIDSFPGAGTVLGARLCALLGSDRERFDGAEQLQLLSGVAPVTFATGGRNGTRSVHRRLRRSKFVHQTVVEWAAQSLRHSEWAKASYDARRAAGAAHFTALRAIGFKWLRVLYHCWFTRTLYSEQYHKNQLILRGSPIASVLAA